MTETVKKDSKIKVLYVITKANWGGAQRYVYDLATALPKERFDVAVACGEGEILKQKLVQAGIRVIPLHSLKRDVSVIGDLATFFSLMRLFKAERPDVVHLNSSKIGGLGAVAGRLKRVPKIIFTAHAWASNEQRPFVQKKVILFLHWMSVFFAHRTIAVSEGIRKDMRGLPFVSKKIQLIRNGIAPIAFVEKKKARAELAAKSPELAKRLARHPELLLIGTISELHTSKGIDFMIEALAAMKAQLPDTPEVAFVIVGGGELKERLEKLVAERNLGNEVFLLGYISEASRLLKAFDIATLTSRTEALGYFLIESGMAGLPVIASSVGGIPEIIKQLETGILVKPGNIKELRDALAFLLKDAEKRHQLGEQLRTKVTHEFSAEKMLKATIALY